MEYLNIIYNFIPKYNNNIYFNINKIINIYFILFFTFYF